MSSRRYYILYDITSDISFIPVDGKSEYGDMAHAKKRADEIHKRKVTWGKTQGNVTFGFIDDEATFAIAKKVKPQTLRSKNPVSEPSMNNQLWRKLAGFVVEFRNANREQLKDAITGLKQGSADFGLAAEERNIYKKLLPILRAKLREFSPKKNPKEKRSRIINGVEYEVMFTGDGWRVMKIDGSTGVGSTEFNAGKGDAGREAALTHLKNMKVRPPKTKKKKSTWEYETAIGVPVRGTLENFSEGQGSDVTYFFRRETGELDVVSGSQLKKAKRLRNPRKKNPEIETRELSLYADNLGPSSQGIELEVYTIRKQFLANVKLNNKRVWTKKRLRNLTNHAAHRAARAYSQVFGQGAYDWKSIFSDADLNRTGKYLYDSWLEEAEAKYKPNPKKGCKDYVIFQYDPKNNIVAFLHASNQWTNRKVAVKFTTQKQAAGIARSAKHIRGYQIGVVREDITTTELKRDLKKRTKGKA